MSPWLKRHGSSFDGTLVPFGSEVFFKAPKSGQEARHKLKFVPRNSGVFLGYELASGWEPMLHSCHHREF